MRGPRRGGPSALWIYVGVAVAGLDGCAAARPPAAAEGGGASPLALDHIWIVVAPGAPEREALERAGLRIAPGVNRHDGQGTTSVTYEFENTFLELVWPDSTVPVSPGLEAVQRRFLRRREWRTSGWSPFGLALRRTPWAPDTLPLPSRRVRADWMPPGEALELLTGAADTLGPSIWVVPRGSEVLDAAGQDTVRRGANPAASLRHPLGVRRLTSVRVSAPGAEAVPPALHLVHRLGVAAVDTGEDWTLELTFDGGRRGQARDLRPTLPLVLRF
jgi:hypothetical protein